MKILIVYDGASLFTSNVREHVEGFARYSEHDVEYVAYRLFCALPSLTPWDGIVFHYTVRAAHNYLSVNVQKKIEKFRGLKILYLQDEYENVHNTKSFIKLSGIDVVFTCVPAKYRDQIYSKIEFPNVRFHTTLTGFLADLPEELSRKPIVNRDTIVSYRGRDLPFWYGDLGQEKKIIGEIFKRECAIRNLKHDIAWEEKSRIYGNAWFEFLGKSRCVLGTESGCNLFDFDGKLKSSISNYLDKNPTDTYEDIKGRFLADRKETKIMNQLSPRLFEAALAGSALVLFEGEYSGVFSPGVHFIPVKKDCSNIDEVFEKIQDVEYLDLLVNNCDRDIVLSGKYTLKRHVDFFDKVIALENSARKKMSALNWPRFLLPVTKSPSFSFVFFQNKVFRKVWACVPLFLRQQLKAPIFFILDFLSVLRVR